MPDLPQELKKTAETRWDEFTRVVCDRRLPWPPPDQAVEAVKASFAFSPFVCTTALRRPEMVVELMNSGDLTGRHAPRELRAAWRSRLGAGESSVQAIAKGTVRPAGLSLPEFQKALIRNLW